MWDTFSFWCLKLFNKVSFSSRLYLFCTIGRLESSVMLAFDLLTILMVDAFLETFLVPFSILLHSNQMIFPDLQNVTSQNITSQKSYTKWTQYQYCNLTATNCHCSAFQDIKRHISSPFWTETRLKLLLQMGRLHSHACNPCIGNKLQKQPIFKPFFW